MNLACVRAVSVPLNHRTRVSWRRRGLLPCIALLSLLLSQSVGCTVRLIADYDEQTDASITELQRKVETFLTRLERSAGRPEASHAANVGFYDEMRVALSSIEVRAAAIPRNEITRQQLSLLRDSLNTLEELHKTGISTEQVQPLRTAFNTSFGAILKLELAKKRGKE